MSPSITVTRERGIVVDNGNRLGRRIAGLRVTADMTQTELADLVGVSTNAISDFERGNRKRAPKRYLVEALDKALNGDGELVRLAGYTPGVSEPAGVDQVFAALQNLNDAIDSARTQLFVQPSERQLAELPVGELVELAGRCVAKVESMTGSRVAEAVGSQLKVLADEVSDV